MRKEAGKGVNEYESELFMVTARDTETGGSQEGICSRRMPVRTASAVRLASSRLRAAWISSGGPSTRYLVVVGALMAEDVTMMCECHGELCAVLGVSGVGVESRCGSWGSMT